MLNARILDSIPRRAAAACALAAALVSASLALAQPPAGGPPPARVVTDRVRLESVERWREVTGELRAPLRSTLASQQAGLVIQLNFEPGDRIEAGKVIAKLDDRIARLVVTQAEASVTTRKALVTERQTIVDKARRDAERYDTAYNASGATQSEVDDAHTALAEAEARFAQAQADVGWGETAVALARKRLEDMTIRAPFTGVVATKRTETGQWLTEGGAVVDLVALDSIDAWLDVPEAFIDRLRSEGGEGSADAVKVQLKIPALSTATRPGATDKAVAVIEAPIAGIIPNADPLSRLFPVRVRIDNKDGRLKPGMSVIGLVPSGTTESALTVSKDAVLRNDTGPFLYYDKGGVAAIAQVAISYALGDRLVVTSPTLSDGVEVVVEGNERLFPGQPLMKLNVPPPAASSEPSKPAP